MTFDTYTTVVLDIEGTTTPLSFVKDCLFPYITDNIADFLRTHWDDQQLQVHIADLRTQAQTDQETNMGFPVIPLIDKEAVMSAVVSNVKAQMNVDRKISSLKKFQGFMWKFAFESGQIKGMVYDDVVEAFERWKKRGVPIHIYSSGSVEAQKLLFGFTDNGNLLPFISSHFDTTVGSKLEAASYTAILHCLNVTNPATVLFISDNPNELKAAKSAGLAVLLANRPGNNPVSLEDLKLYKSIDTFNEVQ